MLPSSRSMLASRIRRAALGVACLSLAAACSSHTASAPANGTLVYTAQWKPTQKGNLIATGSLVSLSHRADAKMFLMMP